MKRRRFLKLAAATLAAGPAAASEWTGSFLGAPARIVLRGPGRLTSATLGRIADRLRSLETRFALHEPASALARLNRTGRLDAPPDLAAVLALTDLAHRLTGGRFDPTIQPLWRALFERRDPVAAREAIGWTRVTVRDGAIRLDSGQQLTLNGIAQGYAADEIRALLAAEGFAQALCDLGEIATLGGPWRLGIADPDGADLARRTLSGTALATSSPGALPLTATETHILGPHGERPLWATVAVEHRCAALADALATAACLMPAPELAALARTPGVHGILAVAGNGDVTSF